MWAGEKTQQLRTLAAFAEDLGSLSQHPQGRTPVPGIPIHSSGLLGTRHADGTHTYIFKQNTHTHKIK